MELLSPAGSLSVLESAVRSGADAVYFGGEAFSARANAANLSRDEIKEAVLFCHERGVKCYAAMNTLVSDREMPEALSVAGYFVGCGIDAFIVQDFGFASLLRKATDTPLHASTQMTVHSLDGACAIYEAGFSRVVLSREISKNDMKFIIRHAPAPLEFEVFVHGALCMCYSGQCYMSSIIGRRSGNRGLCAQPCRLPYQGGYKLSLKDLCLLKYVKELEDIGVTSLKIEGRMKSAEYVSAVTEKYAAAKRGVSFDEKDEEFLAGIFSRGGFTDGYYKNSFGKDMFGTKSMGTEKYDLPQKEYKRLSINFKISVCGEKELLISANTGDGYSAEEKIGFSAAEKLPTPHDKITQALSKTGGTVYSVGEIKIDIPADAFVPASLLNNARRSLIGKITDMRRLNIRKFRMPILSEVFADAFKADNRNTRTLSAGADSKCQPLRGFFLRPENIPANAGSLEKVWLPLDKINTKAGEKAFLKLGSKIGVVLPRIYHDSESPIVKKLLRGASDLGINSVLSGNIGQIKMLSDMNMNDGAEFIIHGDFGLNAYNKFSADFLFGLGLESLVLSFELNAHQQRDISFSFYGEGQKLCAAATGKMPAPAKTGIIAYGRLPFMITRNCIKKQHKKDEFLTDRMNKDFLVTCDYGCRNSLWNSDIMYLADKDLSSFGFLQLFFTDEDGETSGKVIDEYKNHAPVLREGITRGFYK